MLPARLLFLFPLLSGMTLLYHKTIRSQKQERRKYGRPEVVISVTSIEGPPEKWDNEIIKRTKFCYTVQRMWVNFAKTGDPSLSAEESPTGEEIRWDLYNSDTKPVMIFDEFNVHQSTEGDYGIVDWKRTYPLTKYFIF